MGWQRSDWAPREWRPSWMEAASSSPAPTPPPADGGQLPPVGFDPRPAPTPYVPDPVYVSPTYDMPLTGHSGSFPIIGAGAGSVGSMLSNYVSGLLGANSGFDLTQTHQPNYNMPNMFTGFQP